MVAQLDPHATLPRKQELAHAMPVLPGIMVSHFRLDAHDGHAVPLRVKVVRLVQAHEGCPISDISCRYDYNQASAHFLFLQALLTWMVCKCTGVPG
jgi:hypothetical protein